MMCFTCLWGVMLMGRLDKIKAFKVGRDKARMAAEIENENRTNALIKQIQVLKPRIDELLETANVCAENGIDLDVYRSSYFQSVDSRENGTFVTNGVSHHVGFISPHLTEKKFKYLGIEAGGSLGNLDFRTNGDKVFSEEENNFGKISAPLIHHMEKFLNGFDEFESAFYNYIDKLIDIDQPVMQVDTVSTTFPKIDADRLNTLLYNAISCLKDYGCDGVLLERELGITEEEYSAIMNEPVSLDMQIAGANLIKNSMAGLKKEKAIDNNIER